MHACNPYLNFNGNTEVEMPMADTFWGDYFGMCKDKFGIQWMFSYNKNMQGPL